MINSGRVYFFSRPRRFGKSLLISTFEELLKGNKKLFEGLYIYDKWDWTKTSPVIHLDFVESRELGMESLRGDISDNYINNSIVVSNRIVNDKERRDG